MKIGGLQKLTLIDYPSKLACTVFLVGCNYRCPFCYNAELVLPEKIDETELIPEKDFFEFLKERKGILEAVCVGGGEPTMSRDLPEFFQKIKKMGYKIKLDTNGSNPQMLKVLIDKKLVDYVAMDIKAPKEKYAEVIGLKEVSAHYLLNSIEQSINILKGNKIDSEFRTTLVPGLLKKEDILEIAQWLKPAKKYFLQNFNPKEPIDPNFKNLEPYPSKYLSDIQRAIAPFFEICEARE